MKRIISKIKEMWQLDKFSMVMLVIVILIGIVGISMVICGVSEGVKTEDVDTIVSTYNMLNTISNTITIILH